MPKQYFLSVLIVLVLMLLGYWVWQSTSKQDAVALSSRWIAPTDGQARIEGKALYDMYCASCHGVNLEGQFNWRQRMANGRLPAPPHNIDGHTWHHPDAQLVEMIKIGFVGGVNAPKGYQIDMPAFESVLTHAQIELILGYIKSAWPEQALAAQREISLQQ
jgi:S-disulfanyl-L-cysteine oxidoreductase SoxD